MESMIYALALELGGLEEGEARGLSLCCRLAEEELTGMLRDGVAPGDCGEVFSASAARMALADWRALRANGSPKRFTAGEVTVEEREEDPAKLRGQAIRQMASFLKDPAFYIKGVRG